MNTYIEGNLALKHKHTLQAYPSVKVKRVSPQSNLNAHNKLFVLMLVFVCVVIAVTVLWRYSQIYQMNTDILRVQQEMKQLQLENELLKQEIEKSQSSERLKLEATKLGLVPRNSSQVAQISPTRQTNQQFVYNP
jgi:cell division protein FtsL